MRNFFEIQPSCARDLIDKIHREIPGEKIITIRTAEHRAQEFDMCSNGEIGFDNIHKTLLLHRIAWAIRFGGEMIIRQFLPLRIEDGGHAGKKVMKSEKNLFGVQLSSGEIIALSGHERQGVLEQNLGENSSLQEGSTPNLRLLKTDLV